MILYAEYRTAHSAEAPCLVWLHGFLGNRQEWRQVGDAFGEYPQLFIDLPGHGQSRHIHADSFAEIESLLQATLAHYQIDKYWLVGYSMGGRIAMYHACQASSISLQGLVVEAGHPGLSDPNQRLARRRHDEYWALRLETEPLDQVLSAWYQQPIFADLDSESAVRLCQERGDNDSQALAAALRAASLANQPDLRDGLSQLTQPFYYLCGERDSKFRELAAGLSAELSIIANAGHNAHRQCPAGVSQQLRTYLSDLTNKE